MVFPVVGGNESKGYEVENSVRFHNPSQDKLSITPSSASNRKTMTFSCWAKRSTTGGSAGAYNSLFSAKSSGNEAINIAFGNGAFSAGGDYFEVTHGSSAGGGNYDWSYRSNGFYRDFSAWYHVVAAIDTTQSSANDRIKLYVNGVEIDKTVTNSVALNADTEFNNTQLHMVGAFARDDNSHFDGYLAETHFVDGSALLPTSFGKFDDNGVWIPIKYTGSHGTNGFFLEFQQTGTSQNSSGIGADTSGNDNHFAVANLTALDVTEDTCTNNFATLNPLINSSVTFSEGNTKATVGGTVPRVAASTFSVTSGKWYCEVKITATAAGATLFGVEADDFPQNATVYSNGDGVTYNTNGTATTDGSNASYGATYAADDIMGIALNLDDNEITFYKNGASQGAISKTFSGGYVFIGSHGSSSNSSGYNFNFGNPSFSISSGNTDGKYGNFEYAPPSGFYALCTKRLAEFG